MKEENREPEEGNLARYKTRNPETENVPRRTAINNNVRIHKAEVTYFSSVAWTMARFYLKTSRL